MKLQIRKREWDNMVSARSTGGHASIEQRWYGDQKGTTEEIRHPVPILII